MKQTRRAKFIEDASRLAGELYDKMETIAQKEIERVKLAAADTLRDQLIHAFALSKKPIGVAMASAPAGGTTTIEFYGPPLLGKCKDCDTDLDELRKRGLAGHACFGPGEILEGENEKPSRRDSKTSRSAAKRVAPRRRDATPPVAEHRDFYESRRKKPEPIVVPAGATRAKVTIKHGGGYDPRKGSSHPDNQDPTLEEPVRTTNPYSDLEARARKPPGQPPALGMRSHEKIREDLAQRLAAREMKQLEEPKVEIERWSKEEIAEVTERAEASKFIGGPPQTISSSWAVIHDGTMGGLASVTLQAIG